MGGSLVAAADGGRATGRDPGIHAQTRRGVTPCRESEFVSDHETLNIEVNGFPTRVWRKGSGPRLGFLAGFGGLPRWVPFLENLAKHRTVIVPSLPGFPGGDRGHIVLDTHLDWVVAVRDVLMQSDLLGADLAGSSVGGALAAEMAALWPESVRRLALIAPFGLFDEADPPVDPWAQRTDAVPGLMCANPDVWNALKAIPEGVNSTEWPIEQVRAAEAAARIFWPLGNTRLEKRLRLITAPTLLIWGSEDKLMPRSYADRFAKRIKGRTSIQVIPDAGHLAELDQPSAVAEAILAWVG
jgi:abhydrolase domain-containing protein 6